LKALLSSLFRGPQGLLGVLLLVLGVTAYLFFMPKSVNAAAPGPQYDFIFGVHVFTPGQQSALSLSPYVIDGTAYVDAERLPTASQGTSIQLYRYYHQTGSAEPIAMLSESELAGLQARKQFVLAATRHLTLDQSEKSPDGYALAEPNWVPVNPISNVLGNIALFLLSGGFETITKREDAPRLAKDSSSVAIKSKRPLFNNEADTAFLLGWIVSDTSRQE
jgi:hypothetical protein